MIIQGGSWEHVDFSGRRAHLVPGLYFVTSRRIFTDELGVIDMSPNMDTEPHERVMRAAGSYSAVLTNRQSWIQEKFPEFQDLTFDFDTESVRDRVASVLSNPDRYLELGVAFGECFRRVHPVENFVRQVVERRTWRPSNMPPRSRDSKISLSGPHPKPVPHHHAERVKPERLRCKAFRVSG